MRFIGEESGLHYPENYDKWHGNNGELLNILYKEISADCWFNPKLNGVWRYSPILPLNNLYNIVSVNEGNTPLLPLNLYGKKVFIKQEQLFLSGSYKDRGATVLLSKMKELGIKACVQDSSGNAGASIAMYAALANIACKIYVSEDTPKAKIAQIKAYGAELCLVKGNRKAAADAALFETKTLYYASHSFNPLFIDGVKTFAFEIFEQLGHKVPEAIVLPAGNGTLLLGAYWGFKQLLSLGLTDTLPKLIAVQAEASNALFAALNNTQQKNETTLAEGIAIENPVRIKQMKEAILETKGTVITVNDNEIKKTWLSLAKMGFFIEPTSAATIAGLEIYSSNHVTNKPVVSLFTGIGLKSTDKWMQALSLLP